MKLMQRIKENLGISLIVSAISLTFTFIVLSCRKRSVLKALLILAAAQGAAGSLLLFCPAGKKAAAGQDEAEEAPEELFEGEECKAANCKLRNLFCGKHEEEQAQGQSARREVPRDEDASEADFQ